LSKGEREALRVSGERNGVTGGGHV
jgi:hypothetical protein